MSVARAIAPWALVFACACTSDAPVRWTIVLEPPERPGTRYEVDVLEGDCRGAIVQSFEVRRGDAPQSLVLPEGDVSLRVVAVDGDCRVYASGCQTFSVPVRDAIEVRLRSGLDTARCDPGVCVDGRCGGRDAGADAGPACEAGPRFVDEDGDGFGRGVPTEACAGPGFAEVDGDCDDARAGVFPGATERCNRRDDDCDDAIDETRLPGEGCAPCERRMLRGAPYLLCPNAVSWTEARDSCADSGRALVKVEGPELDQALRDAMASLAAPQFWIGLEDMDGVGFQWVDGDPLGAYQPFILGDPDDMPPRCVRSVQDADPQGWRDRRCSDPFPFVCEE